MSYEPPTPPAELPTDIVDMPNGYSLDQLQHVARYCRGAGRAQSSRSAPRGRAGGDEIDDRPNDLPDEVPSKATITIKEINDNRYYYWQWRESDKIKSKYKSPVSPNE